MTPIQITIQAKNAEELRQKIIDLGDVFGVSVSTVTRPRSQDAAQDAEQLTMPEGILNPTPKKTRRPKGALPVEEAISKANLTAQAIVTEVTKSNPKVQELPPVEAAPETTLDEAPTKDLVRQALEKFNEEKGLDAARDLLAKFNCRRLSELPVEKYADFISACQ